ncbi:MAG: phBC6A51 family helix-turn-helix protein [Patescibacteria group bacterium]
MSKKNKIKNIFLEELKKIPIVQIACEKTGISRNSIYRWKRDDKNFSKAMDEALTEGEALVNDMSESQLLTLIKEKNFSAIRFWLNHRNPKFRDKVEVTSKFEDSGELTPSQAEIVRKALQLAEILPLNNKSDDKQNDTTGSGRPDDQGQESKDDNN